MNEGYVKFQSNWTKEAIHIHGKIFASLNKCRSKLYQLKLLGMYLDGIGYGNISVKTSSNTFYITGSATGQYPSLEMKHYAEVLSYSFAQNSLSCVGLTQASAESLTHASVYETVPEANAVIHVHCLWLWEKLLGYYPTTSSEIGYGTPEMALAVQALAKETANRANKLIVMGGHKEGILTYGQNLEEATNEIINIYNQYRNE